MSILTAVRERFSARESSAVRSRDAEGNPVAETALPFAGYDHLGDREVIDGLSDHTQIELEAVEGYERSHKSREPVLDKLRYMRGREPLAGYDALSAEEVVAALKEADMVMIKKVRAYERKFANRPTVLEEVVRVLHRRQAAEPAGAPPAYEPVSARPSRDAVATERS